eukprot:325880-Chlamydomonas_euryale.AAC.14
MSACLHASMQPLRVHDQPQSMHARMQHLCVCHPPRRLCASAPRPQHPSTQQTDASLQTR